MNEFMDGTYAMEMTDNAVADSVITEAPEVERMNPVEPQGIDVQDSGVVTFSAAKVGKQNKMLLHSYQMVMESNDVMTMYNNFVGIHNIGSAAKVDITLEDTEEVLLEKCGFKMAAESGKFCIYGADIEVDGEGVYFGILLKNTEDGNAILLLMEPSSIFGNA